MKLSLGPWEEPHEHELPSAEIPVGAKWPRWKVTAFVVCFLAIAWGCIFALAKALFSL